VQLVQLEEELVLQPPELEQESRQRELVPVLLELVPVLMHLMR
jgi:hypothetical protein